MSGLRGVLHALDGTTRKWLGLSAISTYFVVGGGLIAGAVIETIMINMWIKDTNFYKVVLKKEAERKATTTISEPADGEKPFGEVLKEQWEQRKRELEATQK
tara:strand:- start:358 stop:663 length:306 start_codon:yes stop_codon:yes gene_type:complete